MGLNQSGKITLITILSTAVTASVLLGFSINAVSAGNPYNNPTPTPTATPNTVKVEVCHKDGQSGNYSLVDISVHSVNDANGLNGHGNHNDDIWASFTFSGVNYAGQGDYNGTNFSDCSHFVPTSTAAPTATPTPTPTNFVFPSCVNVLPQVGDKAHYVSGMHQIVGGALLAGSDNVYTLDNGNFLQCFCPEVGNNGTQTNWLKSNNPIVGWFFENGEQWNLGNFNYNAQNIAFTCNTNTVEETPSPTVTPTASADPESPSNNSNDGGDGLGCAVHDCSTHPSNGIQGYGTGGQVLGASTMAGTGSFAEDLYLSIMTLGGTLTGFGIKTARKASK